MPRGFLVKRHYIDPSAGIPNTAHPHHKVPPQRQLSTTDSDDNHSTSSEDVPTDLTAAASKRVLSVQNALSPTTPIIHPYPPPLPSSSAVSSFFQPHHLSFHPMVVDRLHQYNRYETQQHCIYPVESSYSDYFLPTSLYHRAQLSSHHPQVLPPQHPVVATSASTCSPTSGGGLLLDLTIKASTPITPPATPSPSITSASSTVPSHKRQRSNSISEQTPDKNHCNSSGARSTASGNHAKKIKAIRKLHFDEDKSSPVSGTIIRELNADDPPLVVRKGDIDPAFNVVEITDEAKAELAKIENRIGDYICKLCCEMYDDAFSLAQHRCSRIVHVEYRCPECDKVFNCPANLASHRRWHKPRPPANNNNTSSNNNNIKHNRNNNNNNTVLENGNLEPVDLVKRHQPVDTSSASSTSSGDEQDTANISLYPCEVCHKRFRRQAYLKKHLATHGSSYVAHSPTPSPLPHQQNGLSLCAPISVPYQHPPPMLLTD